MIYDCFNFFNELDLLEIRLNTLYEYVDKFVLVESNKTHSGLAKDFIYDKNKDRFSKFLDKIIHIKLTDVPDNFSNLSYTEDVEYNKIINFINNTSAFNKHTQPHYGRDFYQKEAIRFGLRDCCENDIIISSDCDEIINPKVLKYCDKLNLDKKNYTLNQKFYMYYFNVLNTTETPWYGSRIGLYKNVKDYSFNLLRSEKLESIASGGWHFSYMGGYEKIREKIKSYSAQEFNNSRVVDNIENRVDSNIDILGRGHIFKIQNIDESFPSYIEQNKTKFKQYIKHE